MKWMCLPDEYCTLESKFVILPISYEKNLTYGQGASKGSFEIIKASKNLEYYDEQFDCEPFIDGIRVEDTLELNEKTSDEMVDIISDKVKSLNDNFLVAIGGDHAVTIGIVEGYGDCSVIILDAHSDFRDSWKEKNNHACVTKRISTGRDVLVVGVRSQDVDERKQISESENVNVIYSWEFDMDKFESKLSKLKDKVYLSIDVDVFDPSFIRNTGTPEPGGLRWEVVIKMFEKIFKHKTVIGCDVVEFAPNDNFEMEAYSLARLIYKILALKKVYK
jgi:agmatinase